MVRQLVYETTATRSRVPRPAEEEVDLRPGDPDVEQPPFLLRIGRGAAGAERELTLHQARQEHRLELEPLGAVVGEEVHPACGLLDREPARELGQEPGYRRVVLPRRDLRGERRHPRVVVAAARR